MDKISKKKKDKKNKLITSCGGVVFHNDSGKIKFLLLQHRGGKKHWALPKGHLKKGESYLDCAKREIFEETGLSKENLIFIQELSHKNYYSKEVGKIRKKKYTKVVHLFLFESKSKSILLSNEHKKFKWSKFSKIPEIITFKTSLPAFKESKEIILKLLVIED